MKKVNPLLVFTGLALLTLAALAGVTYDRWSPQDSGPQTLLAEAQSDALSKKDSATTTPQGGENSNTVASQSNDNSTPQNSAAIEQQAIENKSNNESAGSDAVGQTADQPAANQDIAKSSPSATDSKTDKPQEDASRKTVTAETNKTSAGAKTDQPVTTVETSPQADKPASGSDSAATAQTDSSTGKLASNEQSQTGEAAKQPDSTTENKLITVPDKSDAATLQKPEDKTQAESKVATVPAESDATAGQKQEVENQAAEDSVPSQEITKTSSDDKAPDIADVAPTMKVAEASATEQAAPEEPAKSSASNATDTDTTPPSQEVVKTDQPAASTKDKKPTFDTVRVETTGDTVAAGEAAPGSEVTLRLDGRAIGKTTANADGSWVIVPDKPLASGAGALSIEQKLSGDGQIVESEQTIAVLVPPKPDRKPVVALVEPDQPVRIIQAPQPEKPATIQGKVALDSIDYNDDGDILFSGRADAGAAVRLYIDNHAKGDAIADASGRWTFTGREDISAGSHALRVDRIDTGGKVVSRIELPFVREEASKVAAIVSAPTVSVGKPETNAAPKQDSSAAPQEPKQPQEPKVAAKETPTASGESHGSQSTEKSESNAAPPSAKSDQPSIAETPDKKSNPEGDVELASPPPPKPEQELAANAPKVTIPTNNETAMPKQSAETEVAAATPAATPETPKQGHIVIQPGNNLWKLSRVIYGRGTHYTIIFEANKELIRNPGRIYPGQIFETPNASPPDKIDPKRKTPLTPDEGGTTLP